MSKKTGKLSKYLKSSSYIYIILGIFILFVSFIALFNWGFFGAFVVNTFRLFVGEAYPLLILGIAGYGLMLVLRRRIYNVSLKTLVGIILVLASLSSFLHLFQFYPQEPLYDSIYQITYDIFQNEFITQQNVIAMGGGMLGALLYDGFTYLFGYAGTILLNSILFFIGLFMVTGITFEAILESLKLIYHTIVDFFTGIGGTVSQAGSSYRDSFSLEDSTAQSVHQENPGPQSTPTPVQTSQEDYGGGTYEEYSNPDNEPVTRTRSQSRLSMNLLGRLRSKFSRQEDEQINWERSYQPIIEYDPNQDFERFTENDPRARKAQLERERIQREKNIVLDLDYFDSMNNGQEDSRTTPRNESMVQSYQGETELDLDMIPPKAAKDTENKGDESEIVTPKQLTPKQESLAPHEENQPQDKQKDKQINIKEPGHWQSQSQSIQDTTFDELDEVLKSSEAQSAKPKAKKRKHRGYQLPGKDLLTKIPPVDQSEEYARINENIEKLERTFDSFGVDAKVVKANLGPAVTKYEIEPAIGVKVSKIVSLSDDIALALAARDIRMEAPIPGKSLIGIEVPNTQVSPVSFWEVIDPALKSDNLLEVPLGRDISGSVCLADLSKMPHLLIAGATGSGKSVGMNVIIVSLLMKAKPHEVKLLMIDPKKVELTLYDQLPHLLSPVVTNPRKAAQALNNVVFEMERRYELFAASGVRNVDGYNDYVDKLNKEEGTGYERLPKIIVFIDELADLMMVASNDVENAIIRLAQMARAAGIHMIIATQRPSVDVITGIIKANIPSRLAFAVSSGTDSRTILDSVGAEKLLGRGDMLFQPMGRSKPLRVQGAYISDSEVERITDFIRDQSEPDYDENIIVTEASMEMANASDDEYFQDAVELIKEQETVSISQLQRKFRIGYNRAARLIDDLEAMGYVSEQDGSKPRQVLINE